MKFFNFFSYHQKTIISKNEILEWLILYNQNNQLCQYNFVELSSQYLLSHPEHQKYKDQNHQYLVNVIGNVKIKKTVYGGDSIYDEQISSIPIQFLNIDGNFECSRIGLKSLKGCPNIVTGFFSCFDNKLKSLEYCPAFIGNDFSCANNQITSLEYGPKIIHGDFNCANNQLTSLKYCPQMIGGNFSCDNNHLTSLEYCPKHISGHFYCHNNQLTSLEYCPQIISGDFICSYNHINTLEYFPQDISKNVYIHNNPELLKYKNESIDYYIRNMFDTDFLNQRDFKFWYQFHLQEKIKRDNENIIEILNFKNENNHASLININKKKV